ncbi:sugar phosphate isomerase/epimerase [candidate division KSB1 bacterium]|nr:sugar phosphate isomerase/epimerase [candidate division KSB1 bacterium]
MVKIPIALQLFSVRDDCTKDFPGTLEKVAEMGYDGVEFAGYYDLQAETIRNLLDDLNLGVAGCHTGLDSLLDDQLQKTVEFNQIIGNHFLIVPGLAEKYTNSIAAWKNTASRFNEIANKLAEFDMYIGYHNHTREFKPVEKQVPWEVFFDHLSPQVIMQLDTGNALHGGCDGIQYIEKYPGRARTVHLKEYSESYDTALIGEGVVDWKRLFRLCESVGKTEWYIVEQENYSMPPMDCVRKCLENLRAMGK